MPEAFFFGASNVLSAAGFAAGFFAANFFFAPSWLTGLALGALSVRLGDLSVFFFCTRQI
jgi:hypothetical protein